MTIKVGDKCFYTGPEVIKAQLKTLKTENDNLRIVCKLLLTRLKFEISDEETREILEMALKLLPPLPKGAGIEKIVMEENEKL